MRLCGKYPIQRQVSKADRRLKYLRPTKKLKKLVECVQAQLAPLEKAVVEVNPGDPTLG